jgi:proteasome lid subunit RPN8/RPN11
MRWLEKILGLKKQVVQEVFLTKTTVSAIQKFAQKAYPREFTAYLRGKVKKDALVIDALLYQNFAASENEAVISDNLPAGSNAIGLVHSHPTNDARPSRADLRTFSKTGACHGIIARPYRPQDLVLYDSRGRLLPWQVMRRGK